MSEHDAIELERENARPWMPIESAPRDWHTPDAPYQEKCGHCGQWFWGRKDAPLCLPCSIKNDLWWRSLTEEQQMDHMRKQIEAIESSKANSV
jgi:hypothetical protein